MARLFAITAASESMQLAPGASGELSFTLSNAASRPLRARPRVVPQGGAQVAWFKLSDESERQLEPGGTHQVTVRVTPPAAAAGTYTFRVDVVSVDNPDEDFTEGPSVSFVVAAPRATTTRGFPWWILIVAGVLVLAVGITLVLVLPGKPGLGKPCKKGECSAGLACSPANICQGDLGFRGCKKDGECITGACRDGVCVDTAGEPCQTAADCGAGKTCTASKVCLLNLGSPCVSDGQCASRACRNGSCTTLPVGAICSAHEQCATGRCRLSRCFQPKPQGALCNAGDECASQMCFQGKCSQLHFRPWLNILVSPTPGAHP